MANLKNVQAAAVRWQNETQHPVSAEITAEGMNAALRVALRLARENPQPVFIEYVSHAEWKRRTGEE